MLRRARSLARALTLQTKINFFQYSLFIFSLVSCVCCCCSFIASVIIISLCWSCCCFCYFYVNFVHSGSLKLDKRRQHNRKWRKYRRNANNTLVQNNKRKLFDDTTNFIIFICQFIFPDADEYCSGVAFAVAVDVAVFSVSVDSKRIVHHLTDADYYYYYILLSSRSRSFFLLSYFFHSGASPQIDKYIHILVIYCWCR